MLLQLLSRNINANSGLSWGASTVEAYNIYPSICHVMRFQPIYDMHFIAHCTREEETELVSSIPVAILHAKREQKWFESRTDSYCGRHKHKEAKIGSNQISQIILKRNNCRPQGIRHPF